VFLNDGLYEKGQRVDQPPSREPSWHPSEAKDKMYMSVGVMKDYKPKLWVRYLFILFMCLFIMNR
jgi:hypothetical protein